jgi:ATP-dependent DNA helicase PIF1
MANSPRPWQRGGSDAAAGSHRRAASGPSEPAAAPPRGIDTSVFDPAFARIAEAAPIVMVLGGAGTGKTVFLHELRRRGGMRQVFLAPTGVAALQLGGQTIHSFFGIPPRILNPDEIKPRSRARKLLRKIDRLVVDEV